MKVFKFGGASVKDANGVRNVGHILNMYKNEPLVVVVSAMGKTTNALEKLNEAYFNQCGDAENYLNVVKQYHYGIMDELFDNKKHTVYDEINNTFVEIEWVIDSEPEKSYDHEYDQIVSIGELLSSKILSAYLNYKGIHNQWIDIRDYLQTDDSYREGKVNWQLTQELIEKNLLPKIKKDSIFITQGFIGCTPQNYTTTLGREGSDYTAAILSHILNVEELTIWKDVPGVLNADPKLFSNAVKLPGISYQEAIELTYHGATVIHPKTIKPLQSKNIGLHVRSFIHPAEKGTFIANNAPGIDIPCFIVKSNQALLSAATKDFSFVDEDDLAFIFDVFAEQKIKMNLMDYGPNGLFVSLTYDSRKLPEVLKQIEDKYNIELKKGLKLITIRHYHDEVVNDVIGEREVFLHLADGINAWYLIEES
jgi:aspartate kinase